MGRRCPCACKVSAASLVLLLLAACIACAVLSGYALADSLPDSSVLSFLMELMPTLLVLWCCLVLGLLGVFFSIAALVTLACAGRRKPALIVMILACAAALALSITIAVHSFGYARDLDAAEAVAFRSAGAADTASADTSIPAAQLQFHRTFRSTFDRRYIACRSSAPSGAIGASPAPTAAPIPARTPSTPCSACSAPAARTYFRKKPKAGRSIRRWPISGPPGAAFPAQGLLTRSTPAGPSGRCCTTPAPPA
jgi:hypothetical protein